MRRQFSLLYKLRVLEEAGACCARAEFGGQGWVNFPKRDLNVVPKGQGWQIRNGCRCEYLAYCISKFKGHRLSV